MGRIKRYHFVHKVDNMRNNDLKNLQNPEINYE